MTKIIILRNEQDEKILSDIFDIALKNKELGGSDVYHKIKQIDLLCKIVADKPQEEVAGEPVVKKEAAAKKEPALKKEEVKKEPVVKKGKKK
jgi:hypothetical protein